MIVYNYPVVQNAGTAMQKLQCKTAINAVTVTQPLQCSRCICDTEKRSAKKHAVFRILSVRAHNFAS